MQQGSLPVDHRPNPLMPMALFLRAGAVFTLLFPLLLAAGTGCGSGPRWGTVEGRVTLDGKAVERGDVRFVPTDGLTPTSGGQIKDGKYMAKVPVGAMRVEITAPKVVSKRKLFDTKDSAWDEITEEMMPARYNTKSQLTLTVESGVNSKDFDLTSK
jgi:hypothetical protein